MDDPNAPTPSDAAEDAPQRVQDEITGQWVPVDETVELHGYRVGAEGKQLLLDRLDAGLPLGGEPERPTVMRRIGCFLLDGLLIYVGAMIVGCILLVPLMMIFAIGGAALQPQLQPGGPMGPAPMGGLQMLINAGSNLLIGAAAITYFALQHARNGQTIGKMAGNLRVVKLDGSAIDTATAWRRSFYFLGPYFAPGLLYLLGPIVPVIAVVIVAGVAGVGAFVYVLVDGIIGLADTDQQLALHDKWTGTRVIWERI
jgi:uncharacterized RDD family membrane protein YckC